MKVNLDRREVMSEYKNAVEVTIDKDITGHLFVEVKALIESSKTRVAHYVNSSLVVLYWRIGKKIHTGILNEERADYGDEIIKNLAGQLKNFYGRGFDARALFRMVRFAKYFPDENIVATLSPLLSWSHFIELSAFDDPLKRDFYTEICRLEHWSVRELRKKIDGMLYERTGISHKPEAVIQESLRYLKKNEFCSDVVFKDPYILDFLSLPVSYSERDLENAILDDLSQFLQELGTDFCFIARQKRMVIDNEDFYLDLLFYHRGLASLVAIDLKLGRFAAAHKGQMELYLRWLNKYERRANEKEPLGLVLCAKKQQEHVELLELGKSGIHVAEYLTQLPAREVLEEKLKLAVSVAQERHGAKGL